MYQQLRGDGVIAFSDPAGAKACLALATMLLKDDPTRSIQLFSNQSYPFYCDWPVEVTLTSEAPEVSAEWLFTGTSHPDTSSGYELRTIAEARRRRVPSWAFVDHWTGLALRFEQRGQSVYPDHVVVVDSAAARKATAEGIPENLIVVHPNPYLQYIGRFWAPSLSRAELLEQIGIVDGSERLLLYAPDPLSLRNADDPWGFDEGAILLDLIEIAKDLPGMALLIKPHPFQPEPVWREARAAAKRSGITLHFVNAPVDSLELMHRADVIVGIQSNFLLEANAMGRPILRYFPAFAEKDAIAHLGVGKKLSSRDELAGAVGAIFARP